MGHQRRPRHEVTHGERLVGHALSGELQLTAHIAVVELHRRRHLRHVVVDSQVLLLAEGVADDEHVAQPVVVDVRPHRSQAGPDPQTEIVLHGFEQARADDGERHLVARNRIVGLGFEGAHRFGGAHDRGTERRRPERREQDLVADDLDAVVVAIGRCAEVTEDLLEVVVGVHRRHRVRASPPRAAMVFVAPAAMRTARPTRRCRCCRCCRRAGRCWRGAS